MIVGIEIGMLLPDINPWWGILGYGLMLVSLFVMAALKPENNAMLIGFSGIPIIRIVAYGIPFSSPNPTLYFGLMGLILLFYIVVTLRLPEIAEFHILKFPSNWLVQIAIMLSGAAVGYFQFLVYPQKQIDFSSRLEFIFFIAALILLAFVEEVIFRGIVLNGFIKKFSPTISILFAAFLYTSLFIQFGSIELGSVVFLASLFYGFAVIRSSGLYGVVGAHFLSSLLYYLILPIK